MARINCTWPVGLAAIQVVLVAGDMTVVAGDEVLRLTAVPLTKFPAAVMPVTVAPAPLAVTEAGVVRMGVTKR